MAWVWRFFRSVEADFSGILSVVVSRVPIGSKRKPSVPRMTMWIENLGWAEEAYPDSANSYHCAASSDNHDIMFSLMFDVEMGRANSICSNGSNPISALFCIYVNPIQQQGQRGREQRNLELLAFDIQIHSCSRLHISLSFINQSFLCIFSYKLGGINSEACDIFTSEPDVSWQAHVALYIGFICIPKSELKSHWC